MPTGICCRFGANQQLDHVSGPGYEAHIRGSDYMLCLGMFRISGCKSIYNYISANNFLFFYFKNLEDLLKEGYLVEFGTELKYLK